MSKIKVIDRLENEYGEFLELTHNGGEEARVYRIEIKLYAAHWDEWWTYRQTEINDRLARERFEDLKAHIQRKVMA